MVETYLDFTNPCKVKRKCIFLMMYNANSSASQIFFTPIKTNQKTFIRHILPLLVITSEVGSSAAVVGSLFWFFGSQPTLNPSSEL